MGLPKIIVYTKNVEKENGGHTHGRNKGENYTLPTLRDGVVQVKTSWAESRLEPTTFRTTLTLQPTNSRYRTIH